MTSFVADGGEWAAVDLSRKKILQMSDGGWRHIQWNEFLPNGDIRIYPAEIFD